MRKEGKYLFWILAVGCFGCMPFALDIGQLDQARYPQLMVMGLSILPLVVAFAFWRRQQPLIVNPKQRLLPLLILGLLAWSGLSIAWSLNAAEAWFSTVQLGLYGAFFLLARQAYRQWPALLPTAAKVLVVSMGLLAIVGLLQVLGQLPTSDPGKLPTGTMTNPNFFADALLLGLPFCVWAAFRIPRMHWKVMAGVSSTLIVAGIVTSHARSSLMPILLVAAIFTPVWIWRNFPSFPKRGLALGVWVVVIASSLWATNFVFRKKEGTTNFRYLWEHGHLIGPRTSSIDFRFIVWHQSFDLATENPLTGCGAGNWKLNIQRLGVKGFDEQAGYGLRNPLQPHNEFLGVLSELGIPGLLLVLAIGGLGFAGAWRQAFSKDPKADPVLGTCLLAGLFFFFFDANFSFPMERPFQGMMLFWMLALSQPPAADGKATNKGWQVWTGWMLAGVALVAGAITLSARVRADAAMLQLREQRAKHQAQAMLKTTEKAQNWAVQIDNASAMPVEWYRGMAYVELAQLPQAVEAMERAALVAPFQFGVRSGLASILDMAGRSAEGAERLSALLVTFPDYQEGWMNLAIMRIHAGQLPGARAALGKVMPGFDPEKYRLIDETLRASGQ